MHFCGFCSRPIPQAGFCSSICAEAEARAFAATVARFFTPSVRRPS